MKLTSTLIIFIISLNLSYPRLYSVLNQQINEKTFIDNVLDKSWRGTGTLMNKKATFSMEWKKVLNNKFIKLEFQNERISDNHKNIVFTATAFYKIVNDTLVKGYWFDNRGVSFPLKGKLSHNEMIIIWGDDKSENGKTIYRHTNENELIVEDFILNNGEYHKFGNATYKTKN